MLPELDVARVRKYVDKLNESMPEHVRSQLRYELDLGPGTLTIIECRPPWGDDPGPEWERSPVVRLRYTKARGEWSLYWLDRNEKFHLYQFAPPTSVVADLLAEITADPTCIFWG